MNEDSVHDDNSIRSRFSIKRESGVVFTAQIILIYIVVLAAIINLSLGTQCDTLWITLLGSCLGCLLPTPKIKTKLI